MPTEDKREWNHKLITNESHVTLSVLAPTQTSYHVRMNPTKFSMSSRNPKTTQYASLRIAERQGRERGDVRQEPNQTESISECD